MGRIDGGQDTADGDGRANLGRRIGFSALRIVLGGALLVGAWVCVPLISDEVADSVTDSMPAQSSVPHDTRSPDSGPVESGPVARALSVHAGVTTAAGAAGTSTTEPFAPPAIAFNCPRPGAGWAATPIASEFRVDPDGFELWWYFDSLRQWIYWGTFASGGTAPHSIGQLGSGQPFRIKAGRGSALTEPGDDTVLTFTTPATPC